MQINKKNEMENLLISKNNFFQRKIKIIKDIPSKNKVQKKIKKLTNKISSNQIDEKQGNILRLIFRKK